MTAALGHFPDPLTFDGAQNAVRISEPSELFVSQQPLFLEFGETSMSATKSKKLLSTISRYRALMRKRRETFLAVREAEMALIETLIAADENALKQFEGDRLDASDEPAVN